MGGLKFKLHPLFLLLGVALFFLGAGYTFIAYTVTLIIHEMGHATMAEKYGYVLDDLKLMPYGAVISGKTEGMSVKEEVIIALAGPAVNVTVALIFTALWWLVPQTHFFTEVFVISNVITALFNLLPVFPLDGGRVALALFCMKFPHSKAMKIVRITGITLAIGLSAAFIVSFFYGFNVTIGIMAIFILISAASGSRSDGYIQIHKSTYLSKNLSKGLPVKEIAILGSEPIHKAFRLLKPGYYCRFLVLNDSHTPIGTLTQTRLEQMAVKLGAIAEVKDAL
jgi:stage IV sporulation protein FB